MSQLTRLDATRGHHDGDVATLVARAEDLCRTIAPVDLDGPVYIVPQSRVPEELGGRSVCYGFTAPDLDLYLQDTIGDGWRGRGPCMVIDDTDFASLDAVDAEQAFMATVLHELAHIVDRPVVSQPDPPADPVRVKFEALCVGHAVSAEPAIPASTPPFAGHGDRFIRAALHLQYRAATAGVTVAPSRICAGRQYGLSHANRYREALGDETGRLAHASIRELLDRHPPEAFSRLWADDVAHWQVS
ncbi:MAG: hypothetical protein JJ992_10165 [Planctomycetes bacterium]|nr:hypothetical protein [Planctomycetota bacterium]